MAGTSPDRSKRYESSTGSTSGSEAPIPDAPAPGAAGSLPGQSSGSGGPSSDPRVAMSRERAPKVDQATAVFSRRALIEAAEAEGLKLDEAEGAERAEAERAKTEGSDAEGSDAEGAKAERAKPEGAGAAGSEAVESGTAGAKADGPETGRGDAADGEGADAGRSDGAGSDAGSADGDGAHEAAEGSDGDSDGDTEAQADSDADEAEGEPSRDADEAEGGPSAAGDEAADTESAAGTGAEAEGDDADPDPRVRGAAAPTSPHSGGTAVAPAVRLPTAEEADPEDDAEAQDDAEPEAAQEPDAGAESKAAAASGSDADKGPGAEGESTSGSASADVRPGAAGATDPRSVGDSAVEVRPGAAGDATGPGSAADARSADADESASGSVGGSGAGSVSVDDEPEAADGEDAPQGPPAGDDESRTGGAGGGSEGDGGAEADRPVDQPTAIFRAPRPPAVDQPTTMLKLGGGAAKSPDVDEDAKDAKDAKSADDADAAKDAKDAKSVEGDDADVAPPVERTSKFVALKPLDDPAAPKPPEGAPALSPAEATRAIPQVGPERTTQQPLPPRPPLDLLAELTNTPPPRQTPVRTVIRRVKIWTPLVILLAIVFAVVQAVRPLPPPTLALTADASYAFEGEKVSLPWPDEGQGWMDVNGIGTVDSFGEQKPVAIGSVAKAMTAYVILKEHPMKAGEKGAKIPVDAKAETEGGYDKDGESTLNTVKEGDNLSQYDAIAAIMIPSANNIARLLARWDSNGSEEEFVKKMNAAAKDLGMTDTTYTDPSGLKETTVSTAEDQVKLGNELVKMKALTDITKLPYWHDPSGQRWDNYNRLVPYDNAIGIKTGSTTKAGGNLLFAATKEAGGETVIVVGAILGQHTPPIIDTVNAVSRTAMLAAQDALTSSTILKKGDVVGYVDDGLGGQTPVVVTKNVSAVGWAGKTVKLELDASASIPNEAKTGTQVGSLTVGDGSGDGVEVPVALQKDLTEPGFGSRLTRVS